MVTRSYVCSTVFILKFRDLYKPSSRKTLLAIYDDGSAENTKPRDQVRICTSCMVRKPLRSKHCSEGMLDHMVGRFDHYCPWVINAVGYKNHQWFLGYLLMGCEICIC